MIQGAAESGGSHSLYLRCVICSSILGQAPIYCITAYEREGDGVYGSEGMGCTLEGSCAAAAGDLPTIPASGFPKKPRLWIFPNTIRKITHYENGGQLPVLTSVLLLKHFQEIIFRQNGDSQFPCLPFFGTRVFSNNNKAGLS